MKIGIVVNKAGALVGLTPTIIKKYIADGHSILIEQGAGEESYISDEMYREAGAKLMSGMEVLSSCELLLLSHPLTDEALGLLSNDTVVCGLLDPYNQPQFVERLKVSNVLPFALEFLPRTSIAQSMDTLSSMASLAGYKAVIAAADKLPGYFPMLTTAAGTVPPAKVLVLGAGVAGLQAIATAKRLGAQVEAFDVRKAVKEEVESLGGRFIEVSGSTDDSDAGGYAVEQSDAYKAKQKELIHEKAVKADVIIATANIPGKKAPILIEKASIEGMRPGSVIVDLAAASGGNCEGTVNNEIVVNSGVTMIGDSSLAYKLPREASKLYSNNLYNFTRHVLKNGVEEIDFQDKIVSDTYIGKSHNAQ